MQVKQICHKEAEMLMAVRIGGITYVSISKRNAR